MQVTSITPVIVEFYLQDEYSEITGYEQHTVTRGGDTTATETQGEYELKEEEPTEVIIMIPQKSNIVDPVIMKDNDIFISSVRYSLGVNTISDATVSLGFKSRKGIIKIKEIFPIEGNETRQFWGNFIIKGSNTQNSAIPADINVFRGRVIGYGFSNNVGNYTFDINLKSYLHPLQQVSIASPGMHGMVPHTLQLAPFDYTTIRLGNMGASRDQAKVENFYMFARALISRTEEAKSGFELFGKLIELQLLALVNTQRLLL